MKIYYLMIVPLIFLLGSSQAPNTKIIDKKLLSGNINLTLEHGVWKLWQEKPVYQNITLDLVCHEGQCNPEVWGYAQKFNQEVDHQGTVKVIKLNNIWQLQVSMKIQFHPWNPQVEEANYTIDVIPYEEKLIGSYSGKFNKVNLQGQVKGNIAPLWPTPVENYQPVRPQEHPRLIFRKDRLASLRESAKTPLGKAILTQLDRSLTQKIYYDGYVPTGGYHATGHCFLALLNGDPQQAEKAWQIVENSLENPGRRILEQSPIVAGVALAYDLCYDLWSEQQRQKSGRWLYSQAKQLIRGDSPRNGWNSNAWSNWSARARGAAGLAALAILNEQITDKDASTILNSSETLAKIARRNIERYLITAIGDAGFGTEGDHYTTEPYILTIIPFLQAYRNVMGQDLIEGSKAEWMIPQYLMRTVTDKDKWLIPGYGRYRRYAGKSLFAMGLGITPETFLPGVMWLFNRHLGLEGDKSFGIDSPYQAVYVFANYRKDIIPKNPTEALDKVLVDRQKGFYVFRNRWQDENDFVSSIYLKQQPLGGSWSVPDVGSYRIWGLGGHWADTNSLETSWNSENVVIMPETKPWRSARPIFFQYRLDGSGIVSLQTNNIMQPKSKPPQGVNLLRSFAVDYSQVSGVPGLFVVVDKFQGAVDAAAFKGKTWVMNTEGKVTLEDNRFTITAANGNTLQGTFIAPTSVRLSFQQTKAGGQILASGGNEFFVVMTVQEGTPPKVEVSGTGLDAQVKVGRQEISFQKDRIFLTRF